MDRATYLQSIERLQDGMSAGDWYEANLSARLAVQSRRLPMELAADLFQVLDPSCGAALMTEHQVVISASPELFVRRSGNHLVTRPIKGSAPRHGQKEADLQQLQGLLSCPKNAAEHLMVVDLARNDLGRICRPGSVRVVDYKLGETHAAVHHLVSTIEGEMPESLSLAPILQALWPPASITGCPKVAVTKALAREETSPRGLYTGAFGVLWPGGDFQFNVAIRTLWSDAPEPDGSRIWTLGSGGAIVADSSPEMEWEEFLFKALPIVGALVDPSARHHLPASFSYEPF
jgi:anthranilate/para-aminobenzoate synthase component I